MGGRKTKNNPRNIGTVVFILIIIVVAIIWYWQRKLSTPIPSDTVTQEPIDRKIAEISLGSQILQKTQNIIENEFPETNPLKQIIKNPF